MRALYLTYNGLTSRIGQAQVFPYLQGLGRLGHQVDVLSFEEPERAALIPRVAADLAGLPIAWHQRRFRRQPPLVAKWLDQRTMAAGARGLVARSRPDFVHARSYVAAEAGLRVAQACGLPLVFDMRGFWIDEKIEGGRWPAAHPFYAWLIRRWRGRETALIARAARIVVLSEAARRVVERHPAYGGQPVAVIPCAVDHDVFVRRTGPARAAARARLGIPDAALTLVYLGSTGSVYLLGDMLRFFALVVRARPGARFLVIGPRDRGSVMAEARAAGVALDPAALHVVSAEHREVPGLLAAADLGVVFRVTGPSAAGVSLTKLGEYLAVGLPVVANDCAGDLRAMLEERGCGHVVPDLTEPSLAAAVARLPELVARSPDALRAASQPLHDLAGAVARYHALYEGLAE